MWKIGIAQISTSMRQNIIMIIHTAPYIILGSIAINKHINEKGGHMAAFFVFYIFKIIAW